MLLSAESMLLIDTRKERVGVLTTGPVAVAGPTFTGWPVSVRSHSTVCTLRPLAHDVRLGGRLGRLRGGLGSGGLVPSPTVTMTPLMGPSGTPASLLRYDCSGTGAVVRCYVNRRCRFGMGGCLLLEWPVAQCSRTAMQCNFRI